MIDTRQRFQLIARETSAAKPNTQASPKAMRKRDVQDMCLSAGFGGFGIYHIGIAHMGIRCESSSRKGFVGWIRYMYNKNDVTCYIGDL